MRKQCDDIAAVAAEKVRFTWLEQGSDDFIELLQKGFQVRVRVGSSVRDTLCNQLGVPEEYLDHRINTIFLDGSPVDDVDSATISAGSTLALSAAMPGFVGAAMRKGGYYARMRQEITYVEKEHESSDSRRKDFFTLKLFNLVARELGPLFLSHGLWLDRGELEAFLGGRSDKFWSGGLKAEVNDRELELTCLASGRFPGRNQMIHFKCSIMTEAQQPI